MPSEIAPKSKFSSKLNAVGVTLVASGALAAFVEPVRGLGAALIETLPAQYQPLALSVLGVVIIVLRTYFTKQPLLK
jgi:uncharacterized membrane-anchored protein